MKTTINREADATQVSTVHAVTAPCAIQADGPTATTPKPRVLALAQDKNLNESFGAVLHLVAVMDSRKPLVPCSEEERTSWEGYRRGLISALLCVTTHEQRCAPAAAALLVQSLLDKARAILRSSSQSEGEA